MPPKADPYATRSQRAVDIVLLLVTALVFFAMIIGHGERHRTVQEAKIPRPLQTQLAHK